MFICCIEKYRSDCHAGKDDATLMQSRSWQIACFNDYQILLLCLLCRALWLFSAAPSEPAADPTFIPQLKRFSPEFCTSWQNFSSHGSIEALLLDRLYGLFEVHVFDRERCLKEFLIEPVERSPEEKHNIRSTYKFFYI